LSSELDPGVPRSCALRPNSTFGIGIG
jgi:hypothetical protein